MENDKSQRNPYRVGKKVEEMKNEYEGIGKICGIGLTITGISAIAFVAFDSLMRYLEIKLTPAPDDNVIIILIIIGMISMFFGILIWNYNKFRTIRI